MAKKKKLTKTDKKVLTKIFDGDMLLKIDKATNSVTIITPLARIRKKGCKKITLVDPKSGPEATEEEEPAELVKKKHEAA